MPGWWSDPQGGGLKKKGIVSEKILRVRGAVRGIFCGLLLCGCSRAPAPSAQEGEQVLYGSTARIQGFDPVRAGDVASSLAIAQVYEGLLQYHYLKRPYVLEPLLAAELPRMSEDGLVFTFTLRRDIYFQDDPCFPDGRGRELTAEDFVYSIKRIADLKNSSSGYWAFDRIAGLDAFRAASAGAEPTDYDLPVAGLQAPDRYTLRIELTEPFPQLLYVLAMHYAFAVPREAVEFHGPAFVNHPVGTGPYRLASWRRNYRVEFERNPKWAETGRVERYPAEGEPGDRETGLLDDAGERLPFADRMVNFVVDDSTTAWMMFLSGQFASSGISRDNWDAVITPDRRLSAELEERGIRLVTSPTLDLFYIGFNMDDPVVGASSDPERVLKNKKLRQALSCALNFDELARFYNHRVYPVYGPIPTPLAGSLKEPSPYRFNLEKARRLLAEAGYPEGRDPATGRRLELTLELGGADANARQTAELMADFFDEIGVVLKPSYNNWPAFLDKMNRRQIQLFQLGWVADYPDAENFLQLFYSKNMSPGPNHANYSNPEFDQLYEQVRVMPESPARTALYEQMAALIVEDCPWLFLYQPMSYGLVHAWLRNYKPHDFPYGTSKYRRLEGLSRSVTAGPAAESAD